MGRLPHGDAPTIIDAGSPTSHVMYGNIGSGIHGTLYVEHRSVGQDDV